MKRLFVGILVLASLSSNNAFAHNRSEESNLLFSKAAAISEKMISGLENKLERSLTLEERNAVLSFSGSAAMLESGLNPQVADNSNQTQDVATLLLCLGAKGAIFLKIGGQVCVSTSGNAYIVMTDGIGISAGVAATATALVFKGNANIKGHYHGGSAGAQVAEITKAAAALTANALTKLLGVDIGYLKNQESDTGMLFGGLAFGPMFDLSLTDVYIK